MRAQILAACLAATPAIGQTGVFVWHDPATMAIRMITLEAADPGKATSAHVLQELSAVSATMTAVSAEGKAVGLCRQERDGNEAPAWLTGYDIKGRTMWTHPAGDYLAALQAQLPKGIEVGRAPDRFTFECVDAGAGSRPGILVFDVQFSASLPEADGSVISDKTTNFVARLYVTAKTGMVDSAALFKKGRAWLDKESNPVAPVYHDAASGEDYQLATDTTFVFPQGGNGQVMYGDRPIRWHGQPVVQGFDFAWFFPQRD